VAASDDNRLLEDIVATDGAVLGIDVAHAESFYNPVGWQDTLQER